MMIKKKYQLRSELLNVSGDNQSRYIILGKLLPYNDLFLNYTILSLQCSILLCNTLMNSQWPISNTFLLIVHNIYFVRFYTLRVGFFFIKYCLPEYQYIADYNNSILQNSQPPKEKEKEIYPQLTFYSLWKII